MSSQKTKVVLGFGGILAALALLRRRPFEPIEYGANVEVAFSPRLSRAYEEEGIAGRRVAGRVSWAPTVLEGDNVAGGLTVKVTNTSTQSGVAAGATLTTLISVKTTDGTDVLLPTGGVAAYGANGQKTYGPYTIPAPLGFGGQILTAIAYVSSPAGTRLATGSANSSILPVILAANILSPLIFIGLNPSVLLTNGMSVPLGQDVIIGFDWQNKSNILITGTVGLTVTYPDGTNYSKAPTAGNNIPVPIDMICPTGARFVSFNVSQTGTYTLKLYVIAKGFESRPMAAYVPYTLNVSVPEIVYGATVVISG